MIFTYFKSILKKLSKNLNIFVGGLGQKNSYSIYASNGEPICWFLDVGACSSTIWCNSMVMHIKKYSLADFRVIYIFFQAPIVNSLSTILAETRNWKKTYIRVLMGEGVKQRCWKNIFCQHWSLCVPFFNQNLEMSTLCINPYLAVVNLNYNKNYNSFFNECHWRQLNG